MIMGVGASSRRRQATGSSRHQATRPNNGSVSRNGNTMALSSENKRRIRSQEEEEEEQDARRLQSYIFVGHAAAASSHCSICGWNAAT
jgi:hypothetical protein